MVCTSCGSDVAENQKFCHECGAALDQPTEPLLLTEPPTIEVAAPVIASLTSTDDVTEATFIIDDSPPTATPTATATPRVSPTPTVEMPAVFDGSDDLAEYPAPRESFKVRVVFILSLFGAIAVLMTVVADVVDIRTTRPAAAQPRSGATRLARSQ